MKIIKYKRLLIVLLINCLISTFTYGQEKSRYSFNVDNFPDVYGGKTELKRFLNDHLIYPSEDFKNKKEGTVLLNFIVNKEGKSTNILVAKSITAAIDKEAIRLVKLIDWMPSHKEGNAVNVKFSLEIPFSLSKYKKAIKERGFDKPLYTDLPTDTSLNIYETAEQSPIFNNPEKTFTEFIYANLEYPDVASRQNIEGNIKLTFVVEPDGMVSNIKILGDGVGGGCNEEAIRVIGLTKYTPTIRDKQYVRYRMSFTMNFSLKNSFKDNSNGSQRSWGQ
jgi:TonB family protein